MLTLHNGTAKRAKRPCPSHPRAQGGWQQPPRPRPVSSSRLPTLESIIPLGSPPQRPRPPLSPSMDPPGSEQCYGCPSSIRPAALAHEGSTPWGAELPWPVSSVLWQALPPRHSAPCHSRLENAQRPQRRNRCAPRQGNKGSF